MHRPPSEPPARSSELIRVLLVDADARVLAALRDSVSAEPGLEVVGAVSGAAAALACAVENAPVVAVVDVVVQGDGSGLTLVHLLSQIPGCHVVAMSLRGGVQAASRVAGASAFVAKGDGVETILSVIREGPSRPDARRPVVRQDPRA